MHRFVLRMDEITAPQQERRRMGTRMAVVGLATLTGALLACGENVLPKKGRSGGEAPDATDATNPPDATRRDPQANCVKPGTPGNERGIGAYCEKGTGECTSDSGLNRFCTADFSDIASVPEDKWFCSTLCEKDEDCGTGAFCTSSAAVSGCVPAPCAADASF
jgi:hypothetical protein